MVACEVEVARIIGCLVGRGKEQTEFFLPRKEEKSEEPARDLENR